MDVLRGLFQELKRVEKYSLVKSLGHSPLLVLFADKVFAVSVQEMVGDKFIQIVKANFSAFGDLELVDLVEYSVILVGVRGASAMDISLEK